MEIDRSVVGTTPTSRVRWGAVVAGGAIAVGIMILLSAFWLALAFGSEVESVADNLEWFTAATAVAALFVGGYIAGRWSGVPGAGPGVIQGFTLWALVVIASLSIGIPSVLNVLNVGRVATQADGTGAIAQGVDTTLWASFIAMAAALVASVLGGMVGGAAAPDDVVDIRDDRSQRSERYERYDTGADASRTGRHTESTHTHDDGRVRHSHAGDDVAHTHDTSQL
jgi:hypothetical protein